MAGERRVMLLSFSNPENINTDIKISQSNLQQTKLEPEETDEKKEYGEFSSIKLVTNIYRHVLSQFHN